jgi:hypothetical protein
MDKKVVKEFMERKISRKSFFISMFFFLIGGSYVYFFDILNLKVEQGFGLKTYGSGPYGR